MDRMTGAHRFYRRPFTNVGNGLKKRGRGGEREREREREREERGDKTSCNLHAYLPH